MPVCWIIAGPNGAGKTTFALEFLPTVGCQNFINADLIAAGISPLAPERELVAASRIFLREIEAYIAGEEDFAFETTLSGRGYLQLIERLQRGGWCVELIYLALPTVDVSRQRVAERVAHGGHNISAEDIKRRFPRSLQNLLEEYCGKTHRSRCFMNDSAIPELIFEQQGASRTVLRQEYFELLLMEANK